MTTNYFLILVVQSMDDLYVKIINNNNNNPPAKVAFEQKRATRKSGSQETEEIYEHSHT